MREGKAPLEVTLSIDCAESSAYTIDRFEWDFDGDGVIDLTSRPLGNGAVTATTLAAEPYEYAAAGTYSPRAQVLSKQNDAGAWAHLGLARPSSGDYSHSIVVVPKAEAARLESSARAPDGDGKSDIVLGSSKEKSTW